MRIEGIMCFGSLFETNKIVIIDHHRRSADFIDNSILTFQEVYASSAAELVTEIIEYGTNNDQLKQIEAESLYAGIMVDTKNFTFKTGVRTFEAAAYLRKYGICRVCFRELAYKGQIPGVKKASW